MLCVLVDCILTHPEGLSKYSSTKKKNTLPYYTPKCFMKYVSLFQKAQ